MGQSESHCNQCHRGGHIAKVGNGGFDESRKLYAAGDDQQCQQPGYSTGIEHGFQRGRGEFSVHQRYAVGIEYDCVNQQKFGYIDHIFLPQDTGDHRNADESQIGEDEHLLKNFSLLRYFVEKGRQHHACHNEDGEHPQSDDSHQPYGAKGNQSCGIGCAGQDQHRVEHIDDHFGHLGVGMCVHHFFFCHKIPCADHDQQSQHLKKYGNNSHILSSFRPEKAFAGRM